MELTIKQITSKAQETLGLIKEKADSFQNQALDLLDKGLTAEAAKIKEDKILPLLEEQNRILKLYEEESQKVASASLEGIASGETIKDTKTEKRYIPTYGLPGAISEYEQPVSKVNPKKLQEQISRFTGKPISKIEVTKGLGVGKTTTLEGLGDQTAQLESLKQEYPNGVIPLTVDGKNNFLVTDEKGITKLVFPTGIQGADVAATLATEAGPLAAGIGAALGLASTGVGAGGAIPAFNAAYATAKGAQTAGFRAAEGVDIRPKQIAGQAGVDFALGSTIDYATLGGGKFIKNRFMTEGVENLAEAELKAMQATLRDAGYDVNVPFTAKSGQRGVDFYNSLAGKFPNSKLGRTVEATRQVLAGFRDKMINARKGDVAKTVVQKLDDDVKNLDRLIIKYDDRIKNSIKNSAQRAFDEVAVAPVDQIRAGEAVSEILTRGKEATRQTKQAEFDNFAQKANQAGVMQTPEELAAVLAPIVAQSGLGKNPGVDKIFTALANAPVDRQAAAQLRFEIQQIQAAGGEVPAEKITRLRDLEEYSQPFDAVRSRNLIQNLQNQVEKDAFGNTKADAVVSEATRAVRGNFEDKLKSAGLTGEWDKFREAYTDYASFQKGQIGKMITDNFGDLQIAPEKITRNALNDSKSIRDVLNAAKAAGDVQGEAFMRDTLQRAYLEQLGLSNGKSVSGTIKDPDPAKMEALFGMRAKYVAQNIDDLKKLKGVDPSKISREDALALTRLMPEIERKKLIESIARKDKVIKKEEELARNFFIKELKSGNIDLLDNQAVLNALSKARNSDVLDIFSKLPPQIRKDAGADMMALLFKEFSDPANKTRLGQDLWDVEKFNKTIGTWKRGDPNAPNIVSKLDAITGSPEMADLFISASKNLGANTPTGEPLYMTWRTMASPGRENNVMFKLYTTLEYPLYRVLAAAYGNDVLKPFLSSLSKNISEETYNRNTRMMLNATLGTSAGIKALAQQARNDPEFAEQLPEIMKMVKEEAVQSMEQNQKSR
jgi:hypothetical protein